MGDESKPGGDAGGSSAGKPADVEPAASPTAPDAGAKPPASQSPSEPAAETPAAKAEDKPAAAAPPKKDPSPKPAKKPAVMETEPWEGPLADALKERFGDKIKELLSYRGQELPRLRPRRRRFDC